MMDVMLYTHGSMDGRSSSSSNALFIIIHLCAYVCGFILLLYTPSDQCTYIYVGF